ncbi:MAG: M23 family metallopeptidase [Paludibacter sp.]|nr:M23 family metallopeptidase [Bacteroidales bacterium]MCM1069123.1 M23 family metallopeptidase [Prevotella sp.]MCM1353562.1 M23 family metallopeptidase [Bacteroides sp.]MCM1442723.1 M23 family metallopeptidase [Muribaculum sp.]MCM1481641.1 M23 family metallopeptidase [Paludibacter sp.]
MAKKQYYLNHETLAMERVTHSVGSVLKRGMGYVLTGILFGVVFFILFFSFFPSPREKQVVRERDALKSQYELLSRQIDQIQLVVTDLQQRDDNLYRVLFQAEPIPVSVRLGADSRLQYYDSVMLMTNSRLATDITRKADLLERELYVQAKSYEDIIELAKTREIRMENIPAIQPVLNKDLTRVASGYGYRIDPVYHTPRFHAGMDFTAPVGTDVYATGNGKVEFVGWKQGYGNTVVVSHGFDYKTLYAHLSKPLVHVGQQVKRGDVIALVGNTGKSTGPHLHYEVRLKDKPVDPRNFYFQDLSPEEYDRMVQLSNNFGNLLD